MRTRIILLICLSCLFNGLAIADDISDAKVANIKKLIEITGSANIGKQFADAISQQMFKIIKQARPDIPDRALVVMNDALTNLMSEKMYTQDGLIERIIPIYSKYFTNDEIKQLLDFYKTPLGQKSISVMPQLLNESMLAGQAWGQSLEPEIQKRVVLALQKEGYLPKAK
ncbi:MAG: DUF2059 domain-containing protein [Methylophilaceae bacterium]